MDFSSRSFLISALLALPAQASIDGPYTADANTVHLFHLDEAELETVASNAVSGAPAAIAFDGNPSANHATDPQPVSSAMLGAGGFSGFGNAANLAAADLGIGLDANASGGFQMGTDGAASPDAISHGSLAGADGSFTLEALVNLNSITGSSREIVCTDNSLANNQRGFQFRINSAGELEFNFIGTNTSTSKFAIPVSGNHAFAAGEWFHAALSFDGPTNTATFYWTRLAETTGTANAIGVSTNETTSAAIAGPLVIGNEARSIGASSEGFLGLIDEVRISNIARAATDFLFASNAVSLTADDAIDTSSFNAAGNWSNSAPPTPGNAYSAAFLLRTPADADDHTFSGDSLTFETGGILMHKGTALVQTYTIPNFILNGGLVRAGTSHTQTMALAGSLTVTGSGSIIRADQCEIVIDSPIAGGGNLTLDAGAGSTAHTITLNGNNSFTGDLTLTAANASSSAVFSSASTWSFEIGANGSSNRILGTGNATFDGAFSIDLTAASANQGDSWPLVDTSTLGAVSFGATFSIPGWTPNNDVWTDPSGTYHFLESSGALIVVPTGSTDIDGDGLPDAWEFAHFGSLSYGPLDNPDGDGDDNATEYANGSAPTNSASNSSDTDADGLPDSWELAYFPDLAFNAGDDPDGDGFGNLQEYEAATDPADPASRPTGTAVKLVPVDDGDSATSEFGYAGSSAINSVAFVRSSLQTFGNQQFMTWYGRHQFDPDAAYNNRLWIGRRTLGSSQWEIFKHPTFTANNIGDGHDVISFGIDGDGYMHLSWGMHGDAFHYAKSSAPVTGNDPIALGPDTTMTGTESTVTYPQFLRLPDGDLLFLFREVASGNGDTYVNRYDTATQTWANVHGSTSTQNPFIKGTGWTPNYNAYLNMPQLGGPDGDDLIITWCWRYEPVGGDSPGNFDGYQTNNHLNFARSPDAGATWQRLDGTPYALPITRDLEISADNRAEIIASIPEGSSLINQASTCLDSNDNPVTCTWWAPETSSSNYRRQYMVVFRDDNGTPDPGDDSWQTRAVSNRATDRADVRYAENHVRDLGRPTVVCDDDDRIIVAYRDNQQDNTANADSSLTNGASNGITIVHSLPKADDPHRLVWVQFDLTNDNLGNYETMIDNELWDSARQLHFLYQASGGQGYTPPANTASRISVLEWDAANYFAHHPQPSVAFNEDHTTVTIVCPSQPSWGYRLWSSIDLQNWQVVETRAGTGEPLVFTQAANAGETRRFWRVEYREGSFN